MEGFENFIGFNPLTALFTLCNLVITFLILKKFLFKPVNKMIDDRQKEIDGLYEDANNAVKEAEALKQDYTEKLRQAQKTSDEIISSATADAGRRSDRILREAKQEADELREKARADIAQEKKKALNDVKQEISSIAVDIAEKVVEKKLDAKDQEALIENFLRDMGDAT